MVAPLETSQATLVLRLNEIYHDVENQAYNIKHPEILTDESARWSGMCTELLSGRRLPINMLDIGTGTGFVPQQFLGMLHSDDSLICADLSSGMLKTCESNLKAQGIRSGLAFLKLNDFGLNLPSNSQDLVTLNSVMHHLATPEKLCREIHRVLKPGGRLVIGHEPTSTFSKSKFLLWNYRIVLPIADWKLFAYETLLRLGWYEALRGFLGRFVPELGRNNAMVAKVNARLLEMGVIQKPLSAATMSSLLDIQSPTAGGSHPQRGFSREDFKTYFPEYILERFETYLHLDKINLNKAWLRKYDRWLALRFPEQGSSLFCCLRKPSRN